MPSGPSTPQARGVRAGPTGAPRRIRTPDQRLRVFISSTLGELAEERQVARSAVEQLRLSPVMFELGARPHPPRALYRSYLEQSDLFVGIYWQRYGWIAPDMEISGLEDEYLLSAGMPRLIYVKRPAPDMEPALADLLDRLQVEDTTSYKPFTDGAELHQLLLDDLSLTLAERFDAADRDVSAPASADAPIGEDPAIGHHPAPVAADLPVPTSSFLGRETVLDEVGSLLDAENLRLVTLTGPGGTGKTRVALEVAAARLHGYPDGVVFVDLSAERHRDDAHAAIVRALGVVDAGGAAPLEVLRARLRDRRVLLVLDNFEQVLTAAAGIGDLLRHCPGLKVLATSREALRVVGERVYEVPPMTLPVAADGISRDEALASEAVRLFVDRATETVADFSLTDGNVADVVAICARLDGLPLAIELAAARVNLFAVDELRARLETRLDVLRGGARDLPARQQTLLGAIEWSDGLLTEDERRVLRVFSVFVGARLADVETTARDVPDLAEIDVVETLGSLVDKSLVRSALGAGGRPRFTMLQTLRDYATRQLDALPELGAAVRRAHAAHYRDLALDLHAQLTYKDRARVIAALGDELGNLRAAWDQLVGQRDATGLIDLLEPLWGYYEARGDYSAALELGDGLSAVLAGLAETPERQRAEYVLQMSTARLMYVTRGFTAETERRIREALDHSTGTSADPQRFPGLRSLATLHMMRSNARASAQVAEEMIAIAEEQADPTLLSEAHLVAALTSSWLDGYDEADRHIETSIRNFDAATSGFVALRAGPNPGVVSNAVSGLIQWMMGFPDRATARMAKALTFAAELDHPYSTAYALFHAALLDLWRGDPVAVGTRADELLVVADAHEYAIWRALALVLRGTAAVAAGDTEAGLVDVERGFDLYAELTTPPVFWPGLLLIRSGAYAAAGRRDDALAGIEDAQAAVLDADPLSEAVAIAHADLLLAASPPDVGAAGALLERAAASARRRGARMPLLQALTRQLDLHRGTPDGDAARHALAAVVDSFTEGFDIPQLRDARAALEA